MLASATVISLAMAACVHAAIEQAGPQAVAETYAVFP
jgi:hypothetical protein